MTTSPRQRAINKVVDHLEYLKETGEKQIEVDMALVKGTKAAKSNVKPPQPVTRATPTATVAAITPLKRDPVAGKKLAAIAERVAKCRLCSLCETRTNTVPGQGNPQPELMFIGEGPGADEDEQGLAFVGRAGQLLTKIIESMGFTRDDVFIGNIVKCRPPGNRVPEPGEMEKCIPYLKEQIAIIQPRVIVCLGATAVKGLFGDGLDGITKIRGQWKTFEGIDVMPTLHPAYLLRNPPAKKDVWEDMKTVLRHLGRPIPAVKKTES